jgi:hypothetical protein
MEPYQNYDPSLSQQSTNTLYGNHYKFAIERLPDLTFFVQSVSSPSVSGGIALQVNPFSTIHHPGERLNFGQFTVTYLVDAHFKNYFSLYYWMKGYGFPHSFEEVQQFRTKQQSLVPNLSAKPIDLEKTRAVLSILTPDTSSIVAELHIDEVFPVELSSLSFLTTDADAPVLTTSCTFSCSSFEVKTYF